jgi:serine/threonine protein kinase
MTSFHASLGIESVPGSSLEAWILENPDRRPAVRKHEIIGDVISAMAAAHRNGICHGNPNLANILLTETAARGFVSPSSIASQLPRPPCAHARITGFGPAGLHTTDRGNGHLYRPPEASNADLDPAEADVFALGVIWYQLLVDRIERPPYDFADVLRGAGQDSHTIAMISRCLASPGRRFANAEELEQEFFGAAPPKWPPVPKGCVDVSQIVREYLTPVSG